MRTHTYKIRTYRRLSISPSNHMKAFTYIHIKAHVFPFTRQITFADNIINPFIKSNKDHNKDQNTSTTYVLSYSMPCITYIPVIINPTDYVFNIHKIHSQLWNPRCGYAPSKALPLLEGSPPTNTRQPKYENIRKNTKNGERIRNLDINQIECPKLKI